MFKEMFDFEISDDAVAAVVLIIFSGLFGYAFCTRDEVESNDTFVESNVNMETGESETGVLDKKATKIFKKLTSQHSKLKEELEKVDEQIKRFEEAVEKKKNDE